MWLSKLKVVAAVLASWEIVFTVNITDSLLLALGSVEFPHHMGGQPPSLTPEDGAYCNLVQLDI